MPEIVLTVPPRIERKFVRVAKKAFPKEAVALLIGTHVGDHVTVDELYIPEDSAKYSTDRGFYPQEHWDEEARDFAESLDGELVGWIHSHPHSTEEGYHLDDRTLSEGDENTGIWLAAAGVCVVQEMSNGRLRASIRWWGPRIPLRVERS